MCQRKLWYDTIENITTQNLYMCVWHLFKQYDNKFRELTGVWCTDTDILLNTISAPAQPTNKRQTVCTFVFILRLFVIKLSLSLYLSFICAWSYIANPSISFHFISFHRHYFYDMFAPKNFVFILLPNSHSFESNDGKKNKRIEWNGKYCYFSWNFVYTNCTTYDQIVHVHMCVPNMIKIDETSIKIYQ